MTFIKHLALPFVVIGLAACSKAPAPAPATPTPAAAQAAAEAPRPATYNKDLQPAEIVWDSPEKKAAWEAAQRARQAPVSTSAPAPGTGAQ
jgi:hypothetical protein